MKERPILFSGPMVRALLDGTKTQTRRIVRFFPSVMRDGTALPVLRDTYISRALKLCPYGRAGDRLWVKETWRPRIAHAHGMDACDCADVTVRYEADGAERFFSEHDVPDEWSMPKAAARGNVTPLFMPRWASRLTLEVTSVRVERLCEISEDDAKAEGVKPFPRDPEGDCWTDGKHTTAFQYLWGEINGWDGEPGARAPWGTNPWVFVVSFRRLTDAR